MTRLFARLVSLSEDERGLATVEYLMVLLLLSVGAAAALRTVGPMIVNAFVTQVAWLSLPVP